MTHPLEWHGLPTGPFRCFLANGYALIVHRRHNGTWRARVFGHGMPQEFTSPQAAQAAAVEYARNLVNTMSQKLNDQH